MMLRQKRISRNVTCDFFLTLFCIWINNDGYILVQTKGLMSRPTPRCGDMFLQTLKMNLLSGIQYIQSSILQHVSDIGWAAPRANQLACAILWIILAKDPHCIANGVCLRFHVSVKFLLLSQLGLVGVPADKLVYFLLTGQQMLHKLESNPCAANSRYINESGIDFSATCWSIYGENPEVARQGEF